MNSINNISTPRLTAKSAGPNANSYIKRLGAAFVLTRVCVVSCFVSICFFGLSNLFSVCYKSFLFLNLVLRAFVCVFIVYAKLVRRSPTIQALSSYSLITTTLWSKGYMCGHTLLIMHSIVTITPITSVIVLSIILEVVGKLSHRKGNNMKRFLVANKHYLIKMAMIHLLIQASTAGYLLERVKEIRPEYYTMHKKRPQKPKNDTSNLKVLRKWRRPQDYGPDPGEVESTTIQVTDSVVDIVYHFTIAKSSGYWCTVQALSDLLYYEDNLSQRQVEALSEHLKQAKLYDYESKGAHTQAEFRKILEDNNLPYYRVSRSDINDETVLLGHNVKTAIRAPIVLFDYPRAKYTDGVIGDDWTSESDGQGHASFVFNFKTVILPPKPKEPEAEVGPTPAPSSSTSIQDQHTSKGKQPVITRTQSVPWKNVDGSITQQEVFSTSSRILDVQRTYVKLVKKDLEQIMEAKATGRKLASPFSINQRYEDHLVNIRNRFFGYTGDEILAILDAARISSLATNLITASPCGLVQDTIAIARNSDNIRQSICKADNNLEQEYITGLAIKFEDDDTIKFASNRLYDLGAYESTTRGSIVTKSNSQNVYTSSFRIFGIDTTINIPPSIRSLASYLSIDCPDRVGIGTEVPWYPSTREFLMGDNIFYVNSGPLHAYTCWQAWKAHSCNSLDRMLGILWDNSTNGDEHLFDNFGFPQIEDKVDGYYYSWVSRPVAIYENVSTVTELENPNYEHTLGDFVARYTLYYPIKQQADLKCPPVLADVETFVIHMHKREVRKEGAKVIEDILCYCLESVCSGGNGSRIDRPSKISKLHASHNVTMACSTSHGIVDTYHKNLVASLLNCGNEAIYLNINKMVFQAAPHLHPNVLKRYVTAYIKVVEEIMVKRSALEIVPRRHAILNTPTRPVSVTAQDLYYCSRDQRVRTVLAQLIRRNIDEEDAKDAIYTILKGKIKDYSTGGDVDLEKCYTSRKDTRLADKENKKYGKPGKAYPNQLTTMKEEVCAQTQEEEEQPLLYYSGRKSKGIAVDEPINKNVQCKHCKKYVPLKYRWVKGYCQLCSYAFNHVTTEEQIRVGLNLHHMPRENNLVHYLQYPTLLMPARPYYKKKPLRKNLQVNEQFKKKSKIPGWKRGTRIGPMKVSDPSQLIGVGIGTRARTLDIGNTEVEENTLRVRIFAEPQDSPIPGEFDKLFRMITRLGLLGTEGMFKGSMRFCPYDFTEGGWLYRQLLDLKIANKNNVSEVLEKTKINIDYLMDNVWKNRNVKDGPFWLNTFEPRKKKLYLEALIKYEPGSKIRVPFTFFLKRELDTHGTELSGCRRAINPRIICNPDALSQVIMGPIMRSATALLHHILNLDNVGTYFGGLSPGEANTWIRKIVGIDFELQLNGIKLVNYRLIENDFSKFDTTYTLDAFKFVLDVYRFWGLPIDSEEFLDVWTEWMQPNGKFRSGTLVRAPVMNASGRADTALMNALINYYVQLAAYIQVYTGKDMDDINLEDYDNFSKVCRIGLLGDDSLTLFPYSEGLEQRVSTLIARFGFEARDMKTHERGGSAVFLGNRVYPTIVNGERNISWGPTIGRRIFKMGTSADRTADPYDWLKQTSLATIKMAGFVPLIGTLARRTLELCEHIQITNTKHYDEKIKYKEMFTTSDIVELDFERIGDYMLEVYSIGKEELVRLEILLASLESVPAIITDPVLDRMVTFDTCGG